ncbi:MAG: penicillin acylase family protein [Chloroflexi bacterium]|nr:penicillin acylase family protein [Chloroflexota bacterium]
MSPSISRSDLEAALPDVTGTLHFAALSAPVEVFRDEWGIPHIKGESERDLFFAQGFVTAQDRLWHMDADRHRALGRWSEWVGEPGVNRDRLLRSAGMGRIAKLDYEAASPVARAMVDAYTAGVNAYIDTADVWPVEYTLLGERPEPWENWHCLTVYKMRNTLLGTFEAKLLRTKLASLIGPEKLAALITGYPQGALLTVPPGAVYEGPPVDGLDDLIQAASEANWLNETDAGSNGWAISGDLTASGLPLVGGDSHRALDTPSVYYQVHLSCPEFTVIGHSVPGFPGALHFCHNEYVAWGMTHGGADTQDLFLERFRENGAGREYEFKGEWRPAEVWRETLKVRDGQDVEIEVTATHHGPVIAGDPAQGTGVAIGDPGLDPGQDAEMRWVDSARDVMRAKSVPDLHQAFSKWVDRVNNYAVADVHGNFGYLHEGKIPIRGESNGWRAVPGWSGEHEWQGYIPHSELPNAINPAEGYAVTCNQRVVGHEYPYYVGLYFTAPHRAERIITRIKEMAPGSATVDDMARIHAERISNPAVLVKEALCGAKPRDDASKEAQVVLRMWDGSMDREQAAPCIYAVARSFITRWQVEHIFGDAMSLFDGEVAGGDTHRRLVVQAWLKALKEGDDGVWPDGHDWPGILAAALQKAVAALAERLGAGMSAWKWGAIHYTAPVHPLSEAFPKMAELLDPPSVPAHGDGDTPLAGSHLLELPYTVTGLSVNRYIFDPSDWTNSRWITPLGSSGNPGSPHYADQAEMWSNVEYIPQLWDWDEIADRAETKQRLEPS